MGLSTSDLWIIMRARDEASRGIRAVSRSLRGLDDDTIASANRMLDRGRAMTTMGAGMVAAGAAGFFALERLGKGAREYEQAAARALTQTDNVKASLSDMKKLGLDVARTIPVAFDQIQPALYDIFSSIDVNMQEATVLVKQFAKDTVAGVTDMETAGRANLAIMNAYGVAVEDVSKVSDFYFQLVRKGVGDYQTLARAVGKAIPSAQRAGQSYEELGGMIAFMTREGLTAAQAGTSAARALDAMSKVKVAERLEKAGIAARQSNGQFRDMSAIMGDLGEKLSGMSEARKVAFLEDLFKGAGGTIQARRFYDLVLKNDEAMARYQKRVKEMKNAGGAAGEAFNIMKGTDQAAQDQAINNLKALQTEFGDIYNTVRTKVVVAFGILAGVMGDMPQGVKVAIVMFALVASSLLVIAGLGTLVAGAFLIISAAMTLLGVTVGGLAIGFGIFLVAAAAIIGIGYAIYKNWSTVGPLFKQVWDQIKGAFMGALEALKPAIAGLMGALKAAWPQVQAIGAAFMKILPIILKVAGFFGGILLDAIVGAIKGIIKVVTGFVQIFTGIVQVIRGIINGDFSMIWAGLGNIVKGALNIIIGVIQFFWNVGILRLFRLGFALLKGVVTAGWNVLKAVFGAGVKLILNIVKLALKPIVAIFKAQFAVISAIVRTGWNVVKTIFSTVIKVIKALVTGNFKAIPGIIKGGLSKLGGIAKGAWNAVKSAFMSGVRNAVDKAKELLKKVPGALKSLPGKLKQAGIDAMKGFWNGLKEWGSKAVDKAKEIASDVAGAVTGFFKNGSPSRLMRDVGRDIMRGWENGLDDRQKNLVQKAGDIAADLYNQLEAGRRIVRMSGWVKALVEKEYADYKKTGNEVGKGVVEGFRDFVKSSNFFTTEDVFGEQMAAGAEDITRMLKDRTASLAQFGKDIEALRLRGANKELIAELIGAGPETAGEVARNLASASDAQIDALNAARKEADRVALSYGVLTGESMFNAGKNVMKGFIDGLGSQSKAMESQMKAIAASLTAEVKKQLGIRSPSKVFMEIGRNLPYALAMGISKEASAVASASRALAAQASVNTQANFGASRPVDPAFGGGGTTYHNEFNITTQEIDPSVHAADLGFEFNRRMT